MIRKREKMFNRGTLSNLNYMNIDNNETASIYKSQYTRGWYSTTYNKL